MSPSSSRRLLLVLGTILTVLWHLPHRADSACCYFSAKEKDILQPSQKVFLTWDPKQQIETFTVQPRFAGNAKDFGMVIPTPGRPKLDAMPRDFFKELAVFTILKRREYPQSKYWFLAPQGMVAGQAGFGIAGGLGGLGLAGGGFQLPPKPPPVKILETGIVGTLDYKILKAEQAEDLFKWLKDHQYAYSGDQGTLDFYIQKKWYFTVMKIDTLQMKRNPDGTFNGDVSPTRFQFKSKKLIYPLKITQISVTDKTEALFYVQAPYKVDLPDDLTYQYQWLPMLQQARGQFREGTFGRQLLPGKADFWLKASSDDIEDLTTRSAKLGFGFVAGKRPEPNDKGLTPTTLEWAKRLTSKDLMVVRGEAHYSDTMPDIDEGFTPADFVNPKIAAVNYKVIQARLAQANAARPRGYLVREAPAEDIKQLRILSGILNDGQFLTKFRKTFTRAEMSDDLLIRRAGRRDSPDWSEYEEVLPTSPP